MKARQVTTRILLPGLALWAVLWACNTPSIPNPPPGPEVISFLQEDDEHWRFFMASNEHIETPGTPITIKNVDRDLWVGGLVTNDGTFLSQPFYGEIGDIIRMTFGEGDDGGSMCYILEPGNNPTEDPRCGN